MRTMPPTQTTPIQQAFELLESDRCIWCEDAPKAATSHLSARCRVEDPDGLLRRPADLQAAVSEPGAAAA
jgi:hypothetical protein